MGDIFWLRKRFLGSVTYPLWAVWESVWFCIFGRRSCCIYCLIINSHWFAFIFAVFATACDVVSCFYPDFYKPAEWHLQLSTLSWGIFLTLWLGLGVNGLLEESVKLDLPKENGLDAWTEEKIKKAMKYGEKIGEGGDILGRLERLIFFAALWSGQYLVIGGWLGFKLGSKWQTWQHIIKVPDVLVHKTDGILELRVRSACGSYQMGRFLLGTLANVLLGLLGVIIGKFILSIFQQSPASKPYLFV